MKLILLIMVITISSCAVVHPPVNPPQPPATKTIFIRLSQVDRDSVYKVLDGTYKKVTYDSTIH